MVGYFSSFIVTLVISLGLGYPAMLLARRLRLMDVPGAAPHKAHAHPTPLAGGLLAAGTLALAMLFFRPWLSREVQVVFAGALVILLFGLWDDRQGLSALPKLVGQLIASVVLISSGVQVYFLNIFSLAGHISPEMAQVLNILVTLFWLVGITNAVNMIDSMNGIVAGLSMIAFASFGAATALAGQTDLAFWAAALFGVSAGLYFWNGLTAKFFLGDSGAQTIGFLLASFGMIYTPLERSPESSWIVPIMLLGIPIFDTTLVVLSRLKRKQMIGSGRRDHTYHRLIALGLSPRLAVTTVHLAALALSITAYFTLYLPPLPALTFFFAFVLLGLALLFWFERKPTLDEIPARSDHA
jgi:UDP-GlcNAc:undecaprenyl-phosphate/decaprenyl-phosphate GlcNAc-1-phosphate transferase